MEKEAVEAKTQRFQHKLNQLRPILEDRKKVYAQKKVSGLRLRNGSIVVGLGLVGLAFLAASVYQSPLLRSPEPASPSPAVRPAVSEGQEKPAVAVVAANPAAATPAEEPGPPPGLASSGETESSPPSVATSSFAVPSAAAAQAPAAEASPTETPPTAANGPTDAPAAQIRIGQSLSCRGVRAHQCRQPQSSFALHEHNQPHVWMVVYSQTVPHTLIHVYYHEGQKYCEVPLIIAHPRTRTWSRVTLDRPAHLGAWRVEIVAEDGEVLDRVAFRVSP
jgi:hypothetical protein